MFSPTWENRSLEVVSSSFNLFIEWFCIYFYFLFCSLLTANIHYALETQSVLPQGILLSTTETCCKAVQIYKIYTLNFHQKDAVPFFTHTQQLTAASSQLPCLCYKSFHHLWKVNELSTLPCVWNALQCPQLLGAALQLWLLNCCNKTDETTSEPMCDTTRQHSRNVSKCQKNFCGNLSASTLLNLWLQEKKFRDWCSQCSVVYCWQIILTFGIT